MANKAIPPTVPREGLFFSAFFSRKDSILRAPTFTHTVPRSCSFKIYMSTLVAPTSPGRMIHPPYIFYFLFLSYKNMVFEIVSPSIVFRGRSMPSSLLDSSNVGHPPYTDKVPWRSEAITILPGLTSKLMLFSCILFHSVPFLDPPPSSALELPLIANSDCPFLLARTGTSLPGFFRFPFRR